MLSTLALLVLFSAIIVFFSREFGALFKKLFAITGVPLFLPLVMASFLVVLYEPWIFIVLVDIKQRLSNLILKMSSVLSYPYVANQMLTVMLLVSLAILPVLALDAWSLRKTWQAFPYSRITSLVIWLFLAVLLSVG